MAGRQWLRALAVARPRWAEEGEAVRMLAAPILLLALRVELVVTLARQAWVVMVAPALWLDHPGARWVVALGTIALAEPQAARLRLGGEVCEWGEPSGAGYRLAWTQPASGLRPIVRQPSRRAQIQISAHRRC